MNLFFERSLEQRLLSRNELGKKGYTVKYRPWEIVHTEAYATKPEALARERSLKSAAGRRFVWEKIEQRK